MKAWDYFELLRAKKDGCSDYKLAQLLDISTAAISNYKSGNRVPDDDMATRIALHLDLSPAQVIADINAERAAADGNTLLAQVWRDVQAMLAGTKKPADWRANLLNKGLVGARGFEPPTTTTPR